MPIHTKNKRFLIISFLILLIIFVYIFISLNVVLVANFTDDVVRPLIGNQATISIESFFFKIQDQFNQIKYSFTPPGKQIHIVPQNIMSTLPKNNFDLSPIPQLNELSPLVGEGVWTTVDPEINETLMAKTFVRPDPKRPYAIVTLVKMNMEKLKISAVAGTREPGGGSHPGPGYVPKDIQKSNLLVAAFNGGFQQKDGHYGMITGGQTYLPLLPNFATLIMYTNDKPQIIEYQGQEISKNVAAIRQNGPLLLQDSQIVTSKKIWNMQTWGLTTTNSMYTWRSGIGVTKEGNLIYATGSSLVPETLADALKAASAVNAMQLDINPAWVRFTLYNALGNGHYSYVSLSKDMVNGGYEFLHGYRKDFFYIYTK